MITASEARFETKHRAKVNEILKECEKSIEQGIHKGEYVARVSIWIGDLPEEVFDAVIKELQDLGYKTELSNYRITKSDAPCDQGAYYETLTIYWAEGLK